MSNFRTPGVYVFETPLTVQARRANTSQSIACFIGAAPRGPVNPTLIDSWSSFRSIFGEVTFGYELGYSVYHYFANGGRDAYILRVTSSEATVAQGVVGYFPTGDTGASSPLLTVTANSAGEWGNGLQVLVSPGVLSATEDTVPTFSLSIRLNGVEIERWNELSTDPLNNRFADTVVNTYSKIVTVESAATPASEDWLFDSSFFSLSGGSEGVSITNNDYLSAVATLSTIEGALTLNAPGRFDAAVVNALINTAENRGNSFVIIDPSEEADPLEIGPSIVNSYKPSSYAAVYYPKLKMVDPTKTGPGAVRDTYPGGAVAGIYARTETQRTVAKAPAGFETDVRNGLGLSTSFTPTQVGDLYNTYGVNLFKAVPGGGIVINGARTLDRNTPGKYIPIRRSMNFLKQALKDATDFAVFEPNDQRLWEILTYRASNVLNEFWRVGGLKGTNPTQAYYVICDETNNTAESIANGEVRIEVGVALQFPAEFVVITISQWTGGANTVTNL
jgi:hypothetical protein